MDKYKEVSKIKKAKLKYIIPIVIGITITGGSLYLSNREDKIKQETKTIAVLSKNVNTYEQITPSDLKIISIPKITSTSGIFTDESDIVGKVATTSLSADTPIRRDSLEDKSKISDIEFVVLKTDYARSGGAKTGDIVDVYKINKNQDKWVTGTDGQLVTDNASVVLASDESGKNVSEQQKDSKVPLLQATTKIQDIKLAVKKGDAKHLIEGSLTEDNGYVLVVKGGN